MAKVSQATTGGGGPVIPHPPFLEQDNAGPGAARNVCLERARGVNFLPFDADNIATPDLVETLVRAMQCDSSRAAAPCRLLGFREEADIESGQWAFRYSPTGGPRVLGAIEGVYGDTRALFSARHPALGRGFETVRWSPHEDWETFVRLFLAERITSVDCMIGLCENAATSGAPAYYKRTLEEATAWHKRARR